MRVFVLIVVSVDFVHVQYYWALSINNTNVRLSTKIGWNFGNGRSSYLGIETTIIISVAKPLAT